MNTKQNTIQDTEDINNSKFGFIAKGVLKPVLMTASNIFLLVISIMAWFSGIPLRAEPKSPINQLTIRTITHSSFKPEFMDKNVTTVLSKNILGKVQGIDSLSSESRGESSNIYITFSPSANMSEKIGELRDVISSVSHSFPDEIRPPLILKYDASDLSSQLLNIKFLSNSNNVKLDHIAQMVKSLKPILKRVPGVGKITVSGISKKSIHVQYKPLVLFHNKLNPKDIEHAINNFIKTSDRNYGKVSSDSKTFNVISRSSIKNIQDIEKIQITNDMTVGDVATIVVKKNHKIVPLFNGAQPAILLDIAAIPDSNPIEVADSCIKIINEFKEKNSDITTYIEDQTEHTREMFSLAKKSFVEACILIFIIVFLFLWSIAGTLIPIIIIPISIIGTFVPMKLLGYSFNNKTISAFILAIGLVVDDAMVIMEKVIEKLKYIKNKTYATMIAVDEMAFSVIVMTLTLGCVFLPLVFAEGDIGNSLREYAVVVSCSVFISGFSSLTLTPMMCSKLLSSHHNKTHEKILLYIESAYANILKKAFKIKKTLLFIVGLAFAGSLFLAYKTPKEDVLATDQEYFSLSSLALSSTEITEKALKKECKQVAGIAKKLDCFEYFSISERYHRISLEGKLKPQFISDAEKKKIANIISSSRPQFAYSLDSKEKGKHITMEVHGNVMEGVLNEYADFIIKRLKEEKLIDNMHLPVTKKQGLSLVFDYNAAVKDGIAPDRVVSTLTDLITHRKVHEPIRLGTSKHDVIFYPEENPSNLSHRYHENFDLIKNIPIYYGEEEDNERKSKITFLDSYYNGQEQENFIMVKKYMAENTETRYLQLAEGVKIGTLIDRIEQLKKELPSGVSVSYSGEAADYLKNKGTLYKLIVLAMIFIILFIAAQFESFIDSFMVFLSVPLCAILSLVTMYYMNSINRSSMLGLITLIGLITKHGILLVDASNRFVRGPDTALEDIISACRSRLRAVIMTTVAMVITMFTLVNLKQSFMIEFKHIGMTIISGLLGGTAMTLFILPIIYYLIYKLKNKLKNRASLTSNKLE